MFTKKSPSLLKWSLKLTLKYCDKLICVSEGLKYEIQQITNYKGENLVSIPNPIELDSTETDCGVSNASKN